MTHRSASLLFALLLALPGAAALGQSESVTLDCSQVPVVTGEELRSIPEIPAEGGALRTIFDVQMKPFCTPVQKDPPNDNTLVMKPVNLRTYVYPDPVTGKKTWGLPGPTLRLRKAELGSQGDSLVILLKNSLAPLPDDQCSSACTAAGIDCKTAKPDPAVCATDQPPADCCCLLDEKQEPPNCFHGDNTTNLHFHGSHVSPQEPQDYSLLELRPEPEGKLGKSVHAAHGAYGRVAYGQYEYRIPEFSYTQPEGTHWYHPHKHGSVSLQVANGMAGALLIEGSFDDKLKRFYDEEKVLVIQQINDEVNLYNGILAAPPTLVNGQVSPKITVRSGEVQRWRIVNATMSALSQLSVYFPADLEVRQIAMDGVQFSPVNYGCQPLYKFDPTAATPTFACNTAVPGYSLSISPGNRADFLVRMPSMPKGRNKRSFAVEARIVGVGKDTRDQAPKLLRGVATSPLFTVVVDDGGEDDKRRPRAAAPTGRFPTEEEWPAMPSYLRNIADSEISNHFDVTWQQVKGGSEPPQRWPYKRSPIAKFLINGRQFDSSCSNFTTKLGSAAEWKVSNETLLNHPYHIHTNAFQMFSFQGVPVQPVGQSRPEPVWMDSLALPAAAKTTCTDPACPGGIPCTINAGETKVCQFAPTSTTLRQRFEEFTGLYVMHCHFLGHEDRGMMLTVQTVCKDKPDFFGLADGKTPECLGMLMEAAPPCDPVAEPAAGGN